MRSSAWLAALAAIAALSQPAHAAPPPKPKLIVALSVDQFAWDVFARYRPTFTAGLKRLADGIAFTGYQSHGGTETCPGHSTILTGRHPSGTGIVANSWFDPKTLTSVYCVSVPGADLKARGPQNMKASTLGEWMKQADPKARVFAVSGKDRAAITMAGHTPDAVYWWDGAAGFVTSSYAGPATPEVTGLAQRFNTQTYDTFAAHRPQLWPAKVPAHCVPLQKPQQLGSYTSTGEIPPAGAVAALASADYPKGSAFQDWLRVSPLFDMLVLDFAETVIDANRIGHGPSTDLLAISFSATDYVGHRFGNGGPEMCAQVAALDQTLGLLFKKLDSIGVPYVVALTADHGGTDAVERMVAQGVKAQRIDTRALWDDLNRAVKGQLGLTVEPFVGDIENLHLNPALTAAQRGPAQAAAIAWLKARPDIAAVYTRAEVATAVPPRGKDVTRLTFLERFNESYDAERSGDIAVMFVENSGFGSPKGPGDTAAGHGTPWDKDRRVPILFWWPGVTTAKPARAAETVDIAPTLAAIAGVSTPAVDGKCLPAVAGRCR